MALAEQLWQANQDLAIACLDHPFVRGIGDGSLSRQRFAYYVGQDAFFLEAFARAYSIAAAKATDWESFGVFHNLATGVLQELQLHGSYAAKWGVNIQDVQPGAATRHYTDFLLATAWGEEVGIITVAMLPCMRLYAYLGQMLAQPQLPSHQYADWIRAYSGSEFAPLVQQLAELGDRYTTNSPQAQSTYRYAMECELAFFQSAWNLK